MNDTPDTCFFARVFGQNWRTTLGQSCAAVGGVLGMTVAAGTWHIVGLVLFALGGVFAGVNGRDANVSSAQMSAATQQPPAPTSWQKGSSVLLLLVCGLALAAGCLAPVTVNVFSSRLAVAVPSGTNAMPITLTIDGGAAVTPSIGLGDAVTSNLATTAKNAFETSSGIGAAGKAAQGAGAVITTIEAAKAGAK